MSIIVSDASYVPLDAARAQQKPEGLQPEDDPPRQCTCRSLLEYCIVLGWLGGVVGTSIWAFGFDCMAIRDLQTLHPTWYTIWLATCMVFVCVGPWFVCLCVYNINTQILYLLLRQSSFWIKIILVLFCVTVRIWGGLQEDYLNHGNVWQNIAFGFAYHLPMMMILFVDVLHKSSRFFRLSVPIVVVTYAIVQWAVYGLGYIGKRPIFLRLPGQELETSLGYSGIVTLQGLMSTAYSSFILLSASSVIRAFREPGGNVMSFPVSIWLDKTVAVKIARTMAERNLRFEDVALNTELNRLLARQTVTVTAAEAM